jgi:hypothetical protein
MSIFGFGGPGAGLVVAGVLGVVCIIFAVPIAVAGIRVGLPAIRAGIGLDGQASASFLQLLHELLKPVCKHDSHPLSRHADSDLGRLTCTRCSCA